MKRILIMIFLVGLSIACFWLAFADIFTPPAPPHKGAAANSASADVGAAGATSGSAAHSSASAGANSSPGQASAINAPKTNSTASFLPCQNSCQTNGASCQRDCYQHYNVTNQTQYWNQCMQSCSTKLTVCSSNCISGVSLPPISTVLPPPPVASAQSSAPIRSTPPLGQQDEFILVVFFVLLVLVPLDDADGRGSFRGATFS